MTTLELKRLLIHRISEINDVPFLEAIKTILESKSENEVIMLDFDQKKEIMDSKKEIEKGQYTDLERMNEKVAKWASEE